MVNMKVLNAGAWSRSSERVPVSLPTELEDFIPSVEEFYRKKHNGRKLYWHHIMSNGVVRRDTLMSLLTATRISVCRNTTKYSAPFMLYM